MDTGKLKAVLLAAQYQSLSKAAQAFSYTPSALSHCADALELELGVKLLQRTHHGVTWTEEGLQLQPKMQAVLDAEKALLEAASGIRETDAHQVRIGTFTSIAVNLLPELLTGFKTENPRVMFSILVENRLQDCLDRGLVDVVFGAKLEKHPWIPVVQDPYVAVVPKNLFAGRKSVDCRELFSHAFILTENAGVANSIDLSRFREIIRLSADDDMAAVSLVRQGMGVTVLPSLVLKKRTAGVRVLKLTTPIYRVLGLSYRETLAADSDACKLMRYIQKHCF